MVVVQGRTLEQVRGGERAGGWQEAGPRRRACLMCRTAFFSAGPHERICPDCKGGEDWRDAAAACHGHIAW